MYAEKYAPEGKNPNTQIAGNWIRNNSQGN